LKATVASLTVSLVFASLFLDYYALNQSDCLLFHTEFSSLGEEVVQILSGDQSWEQQEAEVLVAAY